MVCDLVFMKVKQSNTKSYRQCLILVPPSKICRAALVSPGNFVRDALGPEPGPTAQNLHSIGLAHVLEFEEHMVTAHLRLRPGSFVTEVRAPG